MPIDIPLMISPEISPRIPLAFSFGKPAEVPTGILSDLLRFFQQLPLEILQMFLEDSQQEFPEESQQNFLVDFIRNY